MDDLLLDAIKDGLESVAKQFAELSKLPHDSAYDEEYPRRLKHLLFDLSGILERTFKGYLGIGPYDRIDDFRTVIMQVKTKAKLQERDAQKLIALRKVRNDLEHGRELLELPPRALDIKWFYDFISQFLHDQFGLDFTSPLPTTKRILLPPLDNSTFVGRQLELQTLNGLE